MQTASKETSSIKKTSEQEVRIAEAKIAFQKFKKSFYTQTDFLSPLKSDFVVMPTGDWAVPTKKRFIILTREFLILFDE